MRITLALAAACLLSGGLAGCAKDGSLTPQAQAAITGFCVVDGKLQPVAVALAPTLVPQAASAVAVDQAVIHPAIAALCPTLGGTAAAPPK